VLIVGVIPQSLVNMEISHGGLVKLRIIGLMQERKSLMAGFSNVISQNV